MIGILLVEYCACTMLCRDACFDFSDVSELYEEEMLTQLRQIKICHKGSKKVFVPGTFVT